MPEKPHTTRRQFSLLHFLIGISLMLVTFYAVWRWNITNPLQKIPKPSQLSCFGHGGLYRWTDTFHIFPEGSFEGNVIVLKNDGLMNSIPVSFPDKGSFSIEHIRTDKTTLYCLKYPQGIVLLDLETELKQATSKQWGNDDRKRMFHDNENEWVYLERRIELNNVIHTYKIIICRNERQALSKYSNYSPITHPGKPSLKPVTEPE